MPKTSPIRSAVLVELRLVTDRQTQTPMASTADAQHRAVKTNLSFTEARDSDWQCFFKLVVSSNFGEQIQPTLTVDTIDRL